MRIYGIMHDFVRNWNKSQQEYERQEQQKQQQQLLNS